MARRAVVLLSGGLDSATTLAVALVEGYECFALSFDYGQRHARELESAGKVAAALGARRHLTLSLDLRAIGGSALTDDIAVPKARSDEAIGHGIPVTYVPARNTIFLAHALAWAEVLGAQDIFIGVNALDYSGYPDCRPEFVEAFEGLANLATQAGVEGRSRYRVHTPLIAQTKAQIVARAYELGVDLSLTWSCYEPEADGRACGLCDSCQLRKKGFAEARLVDPVPTAH
ncbi:MAG TPA: 7-cyano-7-deazaguanine synthase QueC [Methylomirabilota bacterium]